MNGATCRGLPNGHKAKWLKMLNSEIGQKKQRNFLRVHGYSIQCCLEIIGRFLITHKHLPMLIPGIMLFYLHCEDAQLSRLSVKYDSLVVYRAKEMKEIDGAQ